MTTPSPSSPVGPEVVHRTEDPSRPVAACPHCDSEAYLCDKSDHGSVGGPAIHCRRSPVHNEFDTAQFGRWAGDQRG